MTEPKDTPKLTLVPKDGITDSNPGIGPDGHKIPGAKPSKFALFTQDWIELQNFVTAALQLPISIGDFDKKYGQFDTVHKKAIEDCTGAFRDLHASAEEFGNPAVLLKEIQTLMGGAKPPSIYGEIVWVANHIADAAKTFSFTYPQLSQVLTESMSKEERKRVLIDILTGPGGLRSTAQDVETKANNLVKRLATFSERIGKNQTAVNKYASLQGKVYEEAVKKLGDLNNDIKDLEVQIKRHNDAYIGYSVGAGAGAALIFVFTFGLGWPIALGYGLGMGLGGAEEARKAMERAKALFETKKGDVLQKLALKTDLDGLNGQIGDIKKYVDAVSEGVKRIVGVWNNQVSALDAIVKQTDLDKMLTFSAINENLKILDAQAKWLEIARDTLEFTTYAFVEYRKAA